VGWGESFIKLVMSQPLLGIHGSLAAGSCSCDGLSRSQQEIDQFNEVRGGGGPISLIRYITTGEYSGQVGVGCRVPLSLKVSLRVESKL
jgi:hypothetical protein